VRFEPVRSALPPIISGINFTISFKTSPEDFRVAQLGFSSAYFFFKLSKISSNPAGRLPLMILVNSLCLSESSAENFFFHLENVFLELCPALRHSFNISSGISNGSWFQSSSWRVLEISSLPRGEPCDAELPALFGEPKAIVVLHAISDGVLVF